MQRLRHAVPLCFVLVIAVLAAACSETPAGVESSMLDGSAGTEMSSAKGGSGPVAFTGGPVFDIDAAPNGNILVAETVLGGVASGPTTVWEIVTQGKGGKRELVEFTTPDGITPINGLASVGRGSFYAAQGGLDLAKNAAVLHVTPAGPRLVADIEAFETENDPDLFAFGDEDTEGYKDPKCAPASGPFTPGPQSNPYHLTRTSGNTALVGDAAGNTLLRVHQNGDIEVVALFTPPTEDGGASLDMDDWLEFPFLGPDGDEGTGDDPTEGDCFVQPVPNAVATADDGTIYVGELTGVGALGVSRVWRIEPGTTDAVCPSDACEVAFTGFTSIIDLAFGPDGGLHVVEWDEAGWLSAFGVGTPQGGTVNRCDVEAETCVAAETGLSFPAALAFDRWGGAWLLENNLGFDTSFKAAGPTVRKLDMD
jgi:hypothetical protein